MATFDSPVFGEAPPPRAGGQGRKGSGKHQAIADALREHPLEWARIATATTGSLAGDITKGRTIAYRPAGAFEGASRANLEDGGVDIYARFLGEDAVATDGSADAMAAHSSGSGPR